MPETMSTKAAEPAAETRRFCRPAIDILEYPEEYRVIAEVPGATPDTTEVWFENGVLTLEARVGARQEADANYLLREYQVADYQRVLEVGNAVDASRIDAQFHNGVLTLRLPKHEGARPRRVKVQGS